MTKSTPIDYGRIGRPPLMRPHPEVLRALKAARARMNGSPLLYDPVQRRRYLILDFLFKEANRRGIRARLAPGPQGAATFVMPDGEVQLTIVDRPAGPGGVEGTVELSLLGSTTLQQTEIATDEPGRPVEFQLEDVLAALQAIAANATPAGPPPPRDDDITWRLIHRLAADDTEVRRMMSVVNAILEQDAEADFATFMAWLGERIDAMQAHGEAAGRQQG